MAKKDKALTWKCEYTTYRVVETLFRVLPLSLCYRIGSQLGLLSRLIIKKRRVAVERNLLIAFGDTKSPTELKKLAKEVFRRSGGNLLASVKTATMPLEKLKKCLTIEGTANIKEFITENNGAIILLPHMGNWEVGARLNEIVYKELPVGALYRPLDNPHLNALVKKRREYSGSQLFDRNDGIAAPLQIIRNNGVLGILADQRVGKTGLITPFFGRLTSFSPLPEVYKKRTKCALIGLAIITTAPGRWKIKYTLEADKNAPANTGDVAQIIESLMKLSPADCFWLQDRWRIDHKPLQLQGKTPIIQPQLHKASLKAQHFGIYLESLDSNNLQVIDALALHRPDIDLTCYITHESSITSSNFKQICCPSLSNKDKFVTFFEQQSSKAYTDLLFLPNSSDLTYFENLHTKICPLDYQQLEQSLRDAGLPEQPLS